MSPVCIVAVTDSVVIDEVCDSRYDAVILPLMVEFPRFLISIVIGSFDKPQVSVILSKPITAASHGEGSNSSAPISGVLLFLKSPSISVVMPTIGIPSPFIALLTI